ncbi:MAG TPA: hypothetical protein VLG69_01425 [Candidatus Andersenbacteria bacterium]|nr:hypothetical protein [Candidatus Andersenbacteria bacterium]
MNEEIDVIYNRYGEPVLRLLDNTRFVGFDGKSVGYLDSRNLYNYNGKHVGWFENGIMRDHNGACVGFGEHPTDVPRPFLPFKQFKPFPAFVEFEPFKQFKQLAPFKPLKQFGWSELEPNGLFFQNI